MVLGLFAGAEEYTEKNVIRVMAGDEKTIRHELEHCHGHADTFLPWMVDYDFYNTPKRS